MSTEDTQSQERTATQIAFDERSSDCEVVETSDVWEGPFPEYDKYGNLTGSSYVRCRDCGHEVLTGRKGFASHRDGCKHEETDR